MATGFISNECFSFFECVWRSSEHFIRYNVHYGNRCHNQFVPYCYFQLDLRVPGEWQNISKEKRIKSNKLLLLLYRLNISPNWSFYEHKQNLMTVWLWKFICYSLWIIMLPFFTSLFLKENLLDIQDHTIVFSIIVKKNVVLVDV